METLLFMMELVAVLVLVAGAAGASDARSAGKKTGFFSYRTDKHDKKPVAGKAGR